MPEDDIAPAASAEGHSVIAVSVSDNNKDMKGESIPHFDDIETINGGTGFSSMDGQPTPFGSTPAGPRITEGQGNKKKYKSTMYLVYIVYFFLFVKHQSLFPW